MVNKYNINEPDLIKKIQELERRISVLERTPQTANAGVNRSGMVVQGGGIFVRRDDEGEQGLISHGSDTLINGEQGMTHTVLRSQSVTSDYLNFDGTPITGLASIIAATVDGGSVDPTQALPSIKIMDKSGDTLIADSNVAHRGFSDPILTTPWNDATFFSTTSGTASIFGEFEWYQYHPHLRVRLLISNDASTVSEFVLTEYSVKDVSTVQYPGSTNSFQDVIIARSLITQGATPNGNPTIFQVSLRRVSGAGTVRARIVSVVGIDLSTFLPF